MKTWGELKNEALGLMFANNSNGVKVTLNDASVQEYVVNMVDSVNYALRDLAGIASPIIKKYTFSPKSATNLLGENYIVWHHNKGEQVFDAKFARSYYFEVEGIATIKIYLDGNVINTIYSNTKDGYVAYKGLIDSDGKVEIAFGGAYPYKFRNVALYAEYYPATDDIPAFKRQSRYDLKTLIPDFRKIKQDDVIHDGEYRKNYNDYKVEGDSIIVLPVGSNGYFDVFYYAYPEAITETTADTYQIVFEKEALDIVPLYMASRLYFEDDSALSTHYLNQYHEKRAELASRDTVIGKEEFISVSGWI